MRITFALAVALLAGAANAHSTQWVGTFAAEQPGATGGGSLLLEYDDDANTLLLSASFSGLSGNTTIAHIHCCNAAPLTGTSGVALAGSTTPGGQATLVNFPIGVRAADYAQIMELGVVSSYSATFVTASGGTADGARDRLLANLTSGQAYFNIHTSTFGAGEIRAFVSVVPEPGTWALMAAGLAVVAGLARRRSA
jgi:hypothetical protein